MSKWFFGRFVIPLASPNLGREEQMYVGEAIASGHVGPDGPFVRRFEEMVAKAAGRRWAVATITGTAALHAAFAVEQLQGTVPTPELAFPAAQNMLGLIGCHTDMVWSGQNHDSYGYTSWIRPGFVWDRAPAIGEPLPGTNRPLECFSFAANKIATCGHGGAVCGDDAALEAEIRSFIHQGYGRPGKTNYRMANLNAALGCAQMERLDELKAAKKRIWNRYAEHLPMIDRGASRWMATADLPHDIVPKLAEMGIETRAEPSGGVSLPCSTHLSEEDQDLVLRCVASLRS